ncbi:hypothetical protein OQA88_9288 [Cercophora sp. LCS_1]
MANLKLFVVAFVAFMATQVIGSCLTGRDGLRNWGTYCCESACDHCMGFTCSNGHGCEDFSSHWNCCKPNATNAPPFFTEIDSSLFTRAGLIAIEAAAAKPADPTEERMELLASKYRCCKAGCTKCSVLEACTADKCLNSKKANCCQVATMSNTTHSIYLNSNGEAVELLDEEAFDALG